MQVYNDELKHYGVKGMRWGVIRSEDSTGKAPRKHKKDVQDKRELKAKKFDELARNAKTEKKRKMYELEAERARAGKLSRRQRQVLVGASIVAAYATYKFVDSGEAQRLVGVGKSFLDGKYGLDTWTRNESFADKNLDAKTAFERVALNINPEYGSPGTSMNCRRCTFAYIKAREGFDVSATRSFSATGQTDVGLYNAVSGNKKIKGGLFGLVKEYTADNKEVVDFFNSKVKNMNNEIELGYNKNHFADNIFKALSSQPTNARGELSMRWDACGGHSMAWEIFDGKPAIFDTQTRTMYSTPEDFSEIANRIKGSNFTRLDNVKIDEKILGRWVVNAKHGQS